MDPQRIISGNDFPSLLSLVLLIFVYRGEAGVANLHPSVTYAVLHLGAVYIGGSHAPMGRVESDKP